MAESTATDLMTPNTDTPLKIPLLDQISRNASKVPVIILSKHLSMKTESLKYILPKKFTISRLLSLIRKTKQCGPEEAVYFYANNKILSYDNLINDIYHKFKSEDGFLYITMTNIPAFG